MKKKLTTIISLLLCCVLLNSAVISASTYSITFYVHASYYSCNGSTYPVSAGNTVKITWSTGVIYLCYLYNRTTGNCTPIKGSSTSVQFSELKKGNYLIYVEKVATGDRYQTFKVQIS